MMAEDEVSIEEVDRILLEIENKYSPRTIPSARKMQHSQMLSALSNEFDSLGLPSLDLTQNTHHVLEQVVTSSHRLVQLHRNMLSKLQDANVCIRSKEAKNSELKRDYTICSKQLSDLQMRYAHMENITKHKLTDKIVAMQKKELDNKDEMQKLKNYYSSKESGATCMIQKLTNENNHLQQLLRSGLGKNSTKDSLVSTIMDEYKQKEKVYTQTISVLQNNIARLNLEIIDQTGELNDTN